MSNFHSIVVVVTFLIDTILKWDSVIIIIIIIVIINAWLLLTLINWSHYLRSLFNLLRMYVLFLLPFVLSSFLMSWSFSNTELVKMNTLKITLSQNSKILLSLYTEYNNTVNYYDCYCSLCVCVCIVFSIWFEMRWGVMRRKKKANL